MWAYFIIPLGLLYVCSSTGQADDAKPAPSTNTYSVTLENLTNGDQSKITVSGPVDSDQLQTKELVERLAREAVNSTQGFNGAWKQKLFIPNDYTKIRPAYLDMDGYTASVPAHVFANNQLAVENAQLKELVKLQEARINLLQSQLNALQEKLK